MSTHIASPRTATFGGGKNQSVGQQFELEHGPFILPFSTGVTQSLCLCFTWNSSMKCVFMLPFACHWLWRREKLKHLVLSDSKKWNVLAGWKIHIDLFC